MNFRLVLSIYDFRCSVLYQVSHFSPALANEVLRRNPDLQAALTGTDIDVREVRGRAVKIGGEVLLHADG